MKIRSSKYWEEKGSIFIVALGMTAVSALVAGTYLVMVEGQADSVARSQCFGSAITVAEAGVEEALAMVNQSYPTNGNDMSWTNTLVTNGWGAWTSTNTTTKSNLVFSGSYYKVIISNAPGGTPYITSVGVVPYVQNAWGSSLETPDTNGTSSTVALIRTIQVSTSTSTTTSIFGSGVASTGDITFSGGATVDSFNSLNPLLSSNGQYTATKVDDKAIVGTDARVIASESWSGSVRVRGYVNTGPGGTIADSGSISIGDNSWVSNSTTGIEASRSNDNFNVTFPSISAPTATFIETPSSGTVNGTNYTLVFQGNNYWGTSNVMYETSINMSGQQNVIITGGNVVLYIPSGDSLAMSGQSFIYIQPGSTLTIYCGASSGGLSGQATLGATNASDFTFYGLPTCTSVSYSGQATFTGLIYCPQATFSASGNATFIGAIVAKSVTFSGNATVHYDESIGSLGGPSSGFAATGWKEITTPLAYQNLPP